MPPKRAKELKPWRKDYLVFGAPYLGPEERAEVMACLDSGWIGSGPRAHRFEEEFGAYLGAKNTVALNSGTAALFLALKSLDCKPGSEVLAPSMTFCATINAIVHAGLKPVLVDCGRDTMNIDPAAVRGAITADTAAILPVHFAGRPCDMGEIMAIAGEHDLAVVEDCAHAIEATIDGRHCGTFGRYGAFSFYVTKNLTTGEGGMLATETQDSADRFRCQALHGLSRDAWNRFSDDGYKHYAVHDPGYKFNLTDIAASIGIHQLARVETALRKRCEIWDYYLKELSDLPLILPAPVPDGVRHARHLFTCLVDDSRTALTRDEVIARLHTLRIGTGVHYTPVHLHPFYRRNYPAKPEQFPNSTFIGERTFSIPLSYAMTPEDAADVVGALHRIF